MAMWENDPSLFLFKSYHRRRPGIYTKKCEDMTKAVPLQPIHFRDDYPYRPMEFRQLVKNTTTWTQADFESLLDYISLNHYAVNCQGLVFLEVYQSFDDPSIGIHNSEAVYIRLLDVIDLTNFGFRPRPSKVPPRKPKYFINGGDALVEDPPVVPPPVVPVVVPPPPPTTPIKDGRPKVDPSFMNDNWESHWVDIDGLRKIGYYPTPERYEVTRRGIQYGLHYGDDNTTNVRKEYFYGLKWLFITSNDPSWYFPVKCVGGLGDRRIYNQARFDPKVWGMYQNAAFWYPMRITDVGKVYFYNSDAEVGGDPWPIKSN